MAKTFYIAGHDQYGAIISELKIAAQNPDVVTLYPEDGKTYESTIRAANIQPGDRVFVASHGSTSGIEWHEGEIIAYSELFRNLPDGLASIHLGSCHGGSSIEHLPYLEMAPRGTLVFSDVSGQSMNYGFMSIATLLESKTGVASPVDTMIETLDNIQPAYLARVHGYKENPELATNPNNVLPYMIGIGGGTPIQIDLNKTLAEMASGPLNTEALVQAHTKVIKRFDTKQTDWRHGLSELYLGFFGEAHMLTGDGFEAESALDAKTTLVRNKISTGMPLENHEELRIGYALAIAYLESSGKLEELRQQAIASPENGSRDVNSKEEMEFERVIQKLAYEANYAISSAKVELRSLKTMELAIARVTMKEEQKKEIKEAFSASLPLVTDNLDPLATLREAFAPLRDSLVQNAQGDVMRSVEQLAAQMKKETEQNGPPVESRSP